MQNRKFRESSDTAVFTTSFVIADFKEITLVTHEKEDGAWQFFSEDLFDDYETVARIVSLGEIISIDASVLELADMKEGYYAYRKFKGDSWIIENREQTG